MASKAASHSGNAGNGPVATPVALVRKLTGMDLQDLGQEGLKDVLEECVRLERFVMAKRTEILAAFGTARTNDNRADPGRQSVDRLAESMSPFGADEIAPILDAAPRTAAGELYTSMRACSCLPRTLESLKAGNLSGRRYREIVTKTRDLPADTLLEADEQITTWNPDAVFQSFRSRLAHWVASHDTRAVAEKYCRVERDRKVEFTPDDDGAAQLFAYGPADSLRALFNKLDRAARAGRDRANENADPGATGADARTLAQRRFDALVDATIRHDDDRPVEAHECRLHVTVPVLTLFGWNDPGELEGYGPIPADMARRLAAGAGTWMRLLTDPVTSRLIAADPRIYRPNAAIRAIVRARDGTCRFPGCNVPAGACQIDHIVPFDKGGPTTVDDLQCLCVHHHQAKTKGIIVTNRHDTDDP